MLHNVPWASLARQLCPSAGPCSRAWRARSRVVHNSCGYPSSLASAVYQLPVDQHVFGNRSFGVSRCLHWTLPDMFTFGGSAWTSLLIDFEHDAETRLRNSSYDHTPLVPARVEKRRSSVLYR